MKKKYITLNKYFIIGCVLSFFIPLVGVFIGYALRDLAPFGDRTICSMDGFSQYYPMLENMSDAIKDGELFYSFNGALGFNLWAQSAYYTNSPLWFLVYFLPHASQLVAINLIVALKFSLSSLFFYLRLYFTHKDTQPVNLSITLPAVSLCYGLSGYALAFVNQLMWADVIMLLPLVILGVERLHKGKSPALYIAMLFLCMWSCFYLSFMVCVFLCLYFVYITLQNGDSLKSFIKKGFRFALCSLSSAGLAAVVLIPVYKALSLTLASELGFEGTVYFKYTLRQMLERLLFFREPSLEYDAPNLYMGVTCVLLLLIALVAKEIPLWKKLLTASFIGFMFITMSLNLGEYVWHGFHYPNQLPGRQSFLFIFLCLCAVADFLVTVPLKKYLYIAISVVICLEVTMNAACQLGLNVWASRTSSIRQFDNTMSIFTALDDEEDFMRIEWADVKKNNYPQQYSYKGVTYYSSTMSADAYNFFQQMGLERYAKNVSVYYKQSRITNSLFGIEFIMQPDGLVVYYNETALPLAFVADKAILDFDLYAQAMGDETQKALWRSITGEDEIDIDSQAEKLKECGMKITSFDTDKIKGTLEAKESGVLLFTIPDDGGWKIYIDGKEAPVIKAAGYFCSVEIEEGVHEIEAVYTVPGIIPGAAISAFTALTLVIIWLIKKRKAASCVNQEQYPLSS